VSGKAEHAMEICITGLENDTRSASGFGLARAIRSAYPNARLVGISYKGQGKQIQWPDFDEQWDAGPWDTIDFTEHRRTIVEILARGAWWISGLPHETRWLAQMLPGHERVLIPPLQAVEPADSSTLRGDTLPGVRVPASISTTEPDWDLNTFGRRHGWRVWLRDGNDTSQRIHSWQAFHQARLAQDEHAVDGSSFLQEHIEGIPEELTFAAYQGDLLASALCVMQKAPGCNNSEAGRVEEAPSAMRKSLAETLKTLGWSGGGTVSLIRDRSGQHWVLGWRAGFPSWIFGLALAGKNLPARLLERATGEIAAQHQGETQEFTQVVIEVPLSGPAHARSQAAGGSAEVERAPQHQRHARAARLTGMSEAVPQIPDEIMADVASVVPTLDETPTWLFLPSAARDAFGQAEELMRRFSTPALQVRVAYSVKTNPDRRLLELAYASGLLAETISQAEVKKAMASGFPAGRIILNGPAKQWHTYHPMPEPLFAVYCESLEELGGVAAAAAAGELGTYRASVLGIRLKPPHIASRFGIRTDMPDATKSVNALIRQLPMETRFGIQFHMGSNAIGLNHWWRLFDQMLDSAHALEAESGRQVSCLDLGGGWFPNDWTDELIPHFEDRIIRRLQRVLPHVSEVCLEPGRALAQSSMALAVHVLETRHAGDGKIGEVVVDGSIAELAYHNYSVFPHRILWHNRAEQRWCALGRGRGRILGRLCMEKDILAEAIDLPTSLADGDLLVFCDAGAYDRSMSYSFGQG
jgi:diaminopimelate decarboxylase